MIPFASPAIWRSPGTANFACTVPVPVAACLARASYPSSVQENYLLGRPDLCVDLFCSELWTVDAWCSCREHCLIRCCSHLITGGVKKDATAIIQSVPNVRGRLVAAHFPAGGICQEPVRNVFYHFCRTGLRVLRVYGVPCAIRRHKLLWCWSASFTSLHSPSGSFCSNRSVRKAPISNVSLLPAPCILGPSSRPIGEAAEESQHLHARGRVLLHSCICPSGVEDARGFCLAALSVPRHRSQWLG